MAPVPVSRTVGVPSHQRNLAPLLQRPSRGSQRCMNKDHRCRTFNALSSGNFDAARPGRDKCVIGGVSGSMPTPTRSVSVGATAGTPAGEPSSAVGLGQRLLAFADAQFLPIGLLVMSVAGALFPSPGAACGAAGLGKLCTFGIFVISGLALRPNDAEKALSSPLPLLFGLATILCFTTAAAPFCLALPFLPTGLALGIAIFSCMPTTLSSGIALTQAVGGNTALAILLTVTSNILGIFTMPFTLKLLLGSAVSLDPVPLLFSLLQTILVPLGIGILLRGCVPGVASAVDANKKVATKAQSCLLMMVPWMQVSNSVVTFAELRITQLVLVATVGALIHCAYIIFNCACVNALKLGSNLGSTQAKAIQRAVVLVGSQKTLPVAVAVISSLSVWLGPATGLAVIPCIICHIMQILLDSVLVGQWLREDAAATSSPKPA